MHGGYAQADADDAAQDAHDQALGHHQPPDPGWRPADRGEARIITSDTADAIVPSVCSTFRRLDLHRFRSGLLRAMLAIKETGDGRDTQRGVQAGCGSHRAHQRSDTASGCG